MRPLRAAASAMAPAVAQPQGDGAGPVGSTVPGCLSPPQLISIRSSEQLEELEESRNSAARNLGVWVDCLLASLERHIMFCPRVCFALGFVALHFTWVLLVVLAHYALAAADP